MPIEIRELQIKVTVNQPDGNKSTTPMAAALGPESNEEKTALINQCIEQVIEIFENKKER